MSALQRPIVVFAGPSLHGAEPATPSVSGACVFWPPAGRGDVLRALAHRPRALVVIDGYFHRVPAVTHQELLYALDSGVPVYGAASMGALRAAELAAFGMRGVGRVFAAYEAGELDGDDEVALVHAPAEYGYAPIGVALVEVRFALARWVARGRLDADAAAAAIAALKRLSFEERTGEALAAVGLPAARLLREIAAESVKREDALTAIAAAAAGDPLASRESSHASALTWRQEGRDSSARGLTLRSHAPPDAGGESERSMAPQPAIATAAGFDPLRFLESSHASALTWRQEGRDSSARGLTLRSDAPPDAGGGRERSIVRRPATGYLSCFKELYLPVPGSGLGDVTLAQALHAFLVLHPDAEAWVRAAREDAFRAASAALTEGVLSDDEIERRTAALRAVHAGGAPGDTRMLPETEYVAEARVALLAGHPAAHAGAPELWRRFGGAPGEGEEPWRLFEAQPDLLPSWDLARRFAFSPARAAAARAARAAAEVLACWRRAHRDARIDPRALHEFAADCWQCAPTEVGAVGIRRGLFSAAGLAYGLREALELLAPAERLAEAINDYPTARAALLGLRLTAS